MSALDQINDNNKELITDQDHPPLVDPIEALQKSGAISTVISTDKVPSLTLEDTGPTTRKLDEMIPDDRSDSAKQRIIVGPPLVIENGVDSLAHLKELLEPKDGALDRLEQFSTTRMTERQYKIMAFLIASDKELPPQLKQMLDKKMDPLGLDVAKLNKYLKAYDMQLTLEPLKGGNGLKLEVKQGGEVVDVHVSKSATAQQNAVLMIITKQLQESPRYSIPDYLQRPPADNDDFPRPNWKRLLPNNEKDYLPYRHNDQKDYLLPNRHKDQEDYLLPNRHKDQKETEKAQKKSPFMNLENK